MAAFMTLYYCVTTYYQSFVSAAGFKPLGFAAAVNAGAISGGFLFGRLSSTRVGRRGTVTIAGVCIFLVLPLFLYSSGTGLLGFGGYLMGLFALGIWGVIPRYLSERFPEQVRAIGPGFAYHSGALLASAAPLAIGSLLDHSIRLKAALTLTILIASVLVVVAMWCGPEAWSSNEEGR